MGVKMENKPQYKKHKKQFWEKVNKDFIESGDGIMKFADDHGYSRQHLHYMFRSYGLPTSPRKTYYCGLFLKKESIEYLETQGNKKEIEKLISGILEHYLDINNLEGA
jgi:hypothetical protein